MSDLTEVILNRPWNGANAGETVYVGQSRLDDLTSGPAPHARFPQEGELEEEEDQPDADQEGPTDLEDVDTELLRAMAKKEGIHSWHFMGHERLVQELRDAGYSVDAIE